MSTVNEQLIEVVFKGDAKSIPGLLMKGADLNMRHGEDGQTALHMACKEGHLDIVKALVTRGGFPNFQDNHGQTPLHVSASLGNVPIVTYLLEREADCLIQDNDQKTPLDLAIEKGFEDIVAVIEKAKKRFEEKLEKEKRQIQEEQKRIDAMKQIIIENEKRRHSLIPSASLQFTDGYSAKKTIKTSPKLTRDY